jgi:GNAT superfamily N-acetyltransferase
MVNVIAHQDHDSSQLVIRPIEPDDAAEVCVLVKQLGYDRPLDEISTWIHSLKHRALNQAAFVATIVDDVVGWIEVSVQHRLQSAPYALIGGLVVKDGFRNQRIGLRLCERAEAWSWETGVAVVRVTSRNTRLDAHRFYENNGYRLTKVSQIFDKMRPDG